MPVARSIRRFPSTSSTIAPDERAVTIGWMLATPGGIAAARRSNRARLFGPGISVISLRSCGMSMDTVCRSGGPESPRSLRAGSCRLGVTDHVDHAEPGPALEPVGEVEAEPPGRARRQRGEHDRIERFPAQEHVLHGEGGIGVAHLAVDVGIERREPRERLLQPGFRGRPGLGLGPGVVPRWLGRDDDVERAGTVPGELGELLEQVGARQGPVRDDQVSVHRITSRTYPHRRPGGVEGQAGAVGQSVHRLGSGAFSAGWCRSARTRDTGCSDRSRDRKSTRLNSSHRTISYAVFCLKKKKKKQYVSSYRQIKTQMLLSIMFNKMRETRSESITRVGIQRTVVSVCHCALRILCQ